MRITLAFVAAASLATVPVAYAQSTMPAANDVGDSRGIPGGASTGAAAGTTGPTASTGEVSGANGKTGAQMRREIRARADKRRVPAKPAAKRAPAS